MAEPNYDIDYSDKRFTDVESDKSAALDEIDKTFGIEQEDGSWTGQIGAADKFYKEQADAVDGENGWATLQKDAANEQLKAAEAKINAQKDQAKKDYIKEQSGAYADYQKASGAYSAEAEQMAAQGMTSTGFSESSQTAKYVAYQNRVAVARESFKRAETEYNIAMMDAKAQNSSALAEIAYNAFQQKLTIALEGFKHKNQLVLEKANKKMETENIYYNRYQDVLKQINQENALAENVRQFETSLAFDREKWEWQKEQATSGGSSGSGGGGSSGGGGGGGIDKDTDEKGNGTEIKDTGKEEIKEDSNKKDLPVDTKSLTAAGLAGASAKKIAAEIAAGRLVEYVKNGKLTYKRVWSDSGNKFPSLPTKKTDNSKKSIIQNPKAKKQFNSALKYRG